MWKGARRENERDLGRNCETGCLMSLNFKWIWPDSYSYDHQLSWYMITIVKSLFKLHNLNNKRKYTISILKCIYVSFLLSYTYPTTHHCQLQYQHQSPPSVDITSLRSSLSSVLSPDISEATSDPPWYPATGPGQGVPTEVASISILHHRT